MFPAKEENIDIMARWHDSMSDMFVHKAYCQVDTLASKARWHSSISGTNCVGTYSIHGTQFTEFNPVVFQIQVVHEKFSLEKIHSSCEGGTRRKNKRKTK